MNKVDFEKGTKRKCASCSTMFYDFNKNPIICPACGAEVSLRTNVTKRGRPSKASTAEVVSKETKDDLVLDDIEVSDDTLVSDDLIPNLSRMLLSDLFDVDSIPDMIIPLNPYLPICIVRIISARSVDITSTLF